MTCLTKPIVVILNAVFIGCVFPLTVSAQQWFLMARHGECMGIESLKRKIPALADINDPHAFIEFMRGRGFTVTSNELAETKEKAVEVYVPEENLSLLFATAELCQASWLR